MDLSTEAESGRWDTELLHGSEAMDQHPLLNEGNAAPTACAEREKQEVKNPEYVILLIRERRIQEARYLIAQPVWDEATCLTLLAALLHAQGRGKEARAHLVEALRAGMFCKETAELLHEYFPDDWSCIWADAKKRMSESKWTEATQLFNRLIADGHNETELLRDAGTACYMEGNEEEAAKLLSRANEEKKDARTSAILAKIMVKRKEWKKAKDLIEEAVKLGHIPDGETKEMLCLCNTWTGINCKGDFDELIAKMEKERAKSFASNVLRCASEADNREMMLTACSFLLEIEPENRTLLQIKVRALAELGRMEEAEQIVARHYRGLNAQEERMKILLYSNAYTEAEKIADELISSGSDTEEVVYTKLYCMARRKELERGRLLATALNSENPKLLKLGVEISKMAGRDRDVLRAAHKLRSLGEGGIEDVAVALEHLGRARKAMRLLEKEYRSSGNVNVLTLLCSMYARHSIKKEEALISQASCTTDIPYELLERGAKLKMMNTDYDGALLLVERALKKKETPEGRYLEAKIFLEAGKLEDAERSAMRSMVLGYPALHAEKLLGEVEEKKGKVQEAIKHYNTAIELGGEDSDLFLKRAKLMLSLGRDEDALKDLSAAEAHGGNEVLLQCVRLYYTSGHYAQCADAAEKLIRKDRRNLEAWKLRGASMLQLKRYEEAADSFEAALSIRKDVEVLRGLKEAYAGRSERQKVVKTIDMLLQTGEKESGLLKEKAEILFSERRYEEAAEAYEELIKNNGGVEAINGRARCLCETGKWLEALHILESADAPDVETLLLQSRCYLKLKRYSDALDTVDKALELDAADARCPAMKAKILIELGRASEAERYADIALQLNPKEKDALETKGLALLEEGNASAALDVFNAAISAGVCDGDIYFMRGECLRKLERNEEALDSYSKALKNGCEDAQLGKGICELKLGRLSAATITLNDYTKKNGNSAKAWYYFGVVLSKQKITEEALKAFRRSLELEETSECWRELGRVHYTLNEASKAKEAFERALSLNPEDGEAKEMLSKCLMLLEKSELEENAKALLRLEAKNGRIPTKEEAFSECHIPVERIDRVMELIEEPTTMSVPLHGESGWEELEELSAKVLQRCLSSSEVELLGLRLCDIVNNFPSMPLDEAKRVFEYISRVQRLEVVDYIDTPTFAKLLRKATKLKGKERSLTGIIKNLGVGIYTAKVIEGSLASMRTSGYGPAFVKLSNEVIDAGNDRGTEELYRQFYGEEASDEERQEGKCLYHGAEAVGYCSSCNTLLCRECIGSAEGRCPNCNAVLIEER